MSDAEDNKPEEEQVEPKIILTNQMIQESLSALYRIPDGSSYSYSQLVVEEKDPQIQCLTDVNDKSVTHNQCFLE